MTILLEHTETTPQEENRQRILKLLSFLHILIPRVKARLRGVSEGGGNDLQNRQAQRLDRPIRHPGGWSRVVVPE